MLANCNKTTESDRRQLRLHDCVYHRAKHVATNLRKNISI